MFVGSFFALAGRKKNLQKKENTKPDASAENAWRRVFVCKIVTISSRTVDSSFLAGSSPGV